MKNLVIFFFLLVSFTSFAQKTDYNTKTGFVAEGYDVVAYFNNKAEKGDKKFIAIFEGVKFKFSSKEHLEKFKNSPEKFIPQYGGYCAFAIGKNGEKVSIDPKTFEIRDEKLYLFYNSWGTNTLEIWTNDGAEKLQKQADINWEKLKTKN